MSYKYKINLGDTIIDLDDMMAVLKGDKCTTHGVMLRREMLYEFGQGGYQFIINTIQEQVDNIKARQPSV